MKWNEEKEIEKQPRLMQFCRVNLKFEFRVKATLSLWQSVTGRNEVTPAQAGRCCGRWHSFKHFNFRAFAINTPFKLPFCVKFNRIVVAITTGCITVDTFTVADSDTVNIGCESVTTGYIVSYVSWGPHSQSLCVTLRIFEVFQSMWHQLRQCRKNLAVHNKNLAVHNCI
jgi:hypothetical protein